ncbi:MAG TPA: hypothetical protein VGI12_10905 [Vicinamibacterales bacterium]|jgi:hypothetical protein
MLDVAIRVLFIGNSLTAANDLPSTVAALGRAAGVRIECSAVAKPDFSLEDHWRDGEARRTIARRGWTFVVLQQGPSALPESRVLLDEYVRRFDAEIRAAGAKTAVYMVWPSRARATDFPAVEASYAGAAAAVGAILFPVGEAWQEAWRRDPSLALYGPDGFHPSASGSALAALVIVETLIGRPPPVSALPGLDAHARAVLAAAADAAIHAVRHARLIPPSWDERWT